MSDKQSDMIVLFDERVGYFGRMAVSYGCLFGLIYIGVLLDSDAMQWVGAILAMLSIIGFAVRYNKQSTKTPQEAADYIAKTYGAVASPEARR